VVNCNCLQLATFHIRTSQKNLPALQSGNDLMCSATLQLLAYFVKIFIFNSLRWLPQSMQRNFLFCLRPPRQLVLSVSQGIHFFIRGGGENAYSPSSGCAVPLATHIQMNHICRRFFTYDFAVGNWFNFAESATSQEWHSHVKFYVCQLKHQAYIYLHLYHVTIRFQTILNWKPINQILK